MSKIKALLYHIVKPLIRFALIFFCRKVMVNTRNYANAEGPLLLAVNHPNSFFDAVMIGMQFKRPVYFLARGDAFRKKWALRILTSLKCIPVYRLREGKEFLHLNEDSFERCRTIFKNNGIVLIFTEGLCINEWNIRPLKKGTARLALSSWQLPEIGDKLRILPAGVNYSSFTRGPKQVWINFGTFIHAHDIDANQSEGEIYTAITNLVGRQFQALCVDGVENKPVTNHLFSLLAANAEQCTHRPMEVLQNCIPQVKATAEKLGIHPSVHHVNLDATAQRRSLFFLLATAVLVVPAVCTIYPVFLALRTIARKTALHTGHYDSVLFVLSTLMFTLLQPLVLILLFGCFKNWILAVSAWILWMISGFILTKFIVNWQRFWNYGKLSGEQRISLRCLLIKTKKSTS